MSWRLRRVENEWEAIALELWRSLGCPPLPIDPYKLCSELGLRIVVTRHDRLRDACLWQRERIVEMPRALSPTQRAFTAAHEAVHWLLPAVRDERKISYIAMALLLPREHIEPHLCAHWDLWRFCDDLAPLLSYEVLARRLLSLRSNAAVSIWKEGRMKAALRYPALRYTRSHAPVEREMAAELFVERELDRIDRGERIYAIADDTAEGRFVITVADLDLLDVPANAMALAES